MRDYALGTTFDLKFNTRQFTTGIPFTLAGTPSIAAYADDDDVELTAGITLDVDFDSVTGLHNVHVVATSGNGYAAGSNYSLVIAAGTVDSVSVVGTVIGEFSIEAQSPLRPTVAGRTLDVTATGAAGIDWANVENQGATVDLADTTVAAVAVVGAVVGLNPALLDAAVSTRATPAQVNAEVLDVLGTDTFAEPTGVPPATDTLANKIGRLHQALRNRVDVDSNTGKKQFFNDANATLWEKDLTDAGGTYSESEGNAP